MILHFHENDETLKNDAFCNFIKSMKSAFFFDIFWCSIDDMAVNMSGAGMLDI